MCGKEGEGEGVQYSVRTETSLNKGETPFLGEERPFTHWYRFYYYYTLLWARCVGMGSTYETIVRLCQPVSVIKSIHLHQNSQE